MNPAEAEPALRVENVSFGYGARLVLEDIGFAAARGRFTALVGPNGAGKTTLFSLITGLLACRHGRIVIAGRDTRLAGASALQPLGIVFQQPTLDPDLSVRQNLAYFAGLRGLSSREAGRRIERELDRAGLAERRADKVRNLSGGQRRRVEIARALLGEPELLVLDEPTVGLDMPSRSAIVAHVHALAAENSLGVLWATHLIDEIRPSDNVVLIDGGRIAASGTAGEIASRFGEGSLEAAFKRLTTQGEPA